MGLYYPPVSEPEPQPDSSQGQAGGMFTTLDLNRNFQTLESAQANSTGRPIRVRNTTRRNSVLRSAANPTFRVVPASPPPAETPSPSSSSGVSPVIAPAVSAEASSETSNPTLPTSSQVLADAPSSEGPILRRRKGIVLKWARLVGQHSVVRTPASHSNGLLQHANCSSKGNITRYIKAYIYYNGECIPINNDDLLLVGDLGAEDKTIYFAIRHTIQMKFITEVIRKTDFPYRQLDTKRWACRSFSDLTLPAPLVRDMSLFQQKDALLVLVVDEGQAPDPQILEAYKNAPLGWHFNEFSLNTFNFDSFVRMALTSPDDF
jgi:hypothetical protein